MSGSPIHLFLSKAPVKPENFALELSKQCQELEVAEFDVYGDYNSPNSWLKKFEKEVATYFGKSEGIFLPSGTMGQAITLKIASESNGSNKFVVHYSSHILLYENNSYEHLLRMEPIIVPLPTESIQQPISFEDVKLLLTSTEDKPAIIVIECPHREIGGKLTDYEDLVQISQLARSLGIHIHMDGARLWEAQAGYSQSITDICDLFDTIYVSFYKGLGGITGAMLLGSEKFIIEARLWSRRFGGNLYSQLPYAVSSWHGFRKYKDAFTERKLRLQTIVAKLTVEFIYNKEFLIRFDPPVPQVSMIHIYLNASDTLCVQAKDLALAETGISCFFRIRLANIGNTKGQSCLELNMGPLNSEIDETVWIKGWKSFLDHLVRLKSESH